jgi:hypothetical protein
MHGLDIIVLWNGCESRLGPRFLDGAACAPVLRLTRFVVCLQPD